MKQLSDFKVITAGCRRCATSAHIGT